MHTIRYTVGRYDEPTKIENNGYYRRILFQRQSKIYTYRLPAPIINIFCVCMCVVLKKSVVVALVVSFSSLKISAKWFSKYIQWQTHRHTFDYGSNEWENVCSSFKHFSSRFYTFNVCVFAFFNTKCYLPPIQLLLPS